MTDTEMCTLVEISSGAFAAASDEKQTEEQEDFLAQFEAFATNNKDGDDKKNDPLGNEEQDPKDSNFLSSFEVFAKESKTFTTVVEEDGDVDIVEEFDIGVKNSDEQSDAIDEDAFNEGLEYDSSGKDGKTEKKRRCGETRQAWNFVEESGICGTQYL